MQAGCHRFESVRLHHKPTRSESTVLVLSRPVGTHRAISRAIYIVQRDNQRCRLDPRVGPVVASSSELGTNDNVVQVKYTNQMSGSCMGTGQKVLSAMERAGNVHAFDRKRPPRQAKGRGIERPHPPGHGSFFFRIKSSAIRAFGGCLGSKRR